jgi:hypothetical protein
MSGLPYGEGRSTYDQQTAAPMAGSAPTPPAPDLTLADIQSFKMIIEIASTRGAFRAEELQGIGQLYGKLDAFLKAQASE